MNFKKYSIICLALIFLTVIVIGQASAIDVNGTNDDLAVIDDIASVDNDDGPDLNIDNQIVSSTGDAEILSEDYVPDEAGIYVATTGSDDSGDGSYSNPYQTISKGISSADAGKTIYIASGTYYISSSLEISKALKFVGYDGTQPVIDAQNSCRILEVAQTSNFEFSFSNITFTHGYATNGGVMQMGDLDGKSPYTNFKGTAYFTNCSFIENTATTNGGVFHQQYAARMEDYVYTTSCVFINNTASSGSIFWGSGMDTITMKYCLCYGNSGTVFKTNNGRWMSLQDNYWGVPNPDSIIDEGSMDYGNNIKLTLTSDVDEITVAETAVFTAKFVRSNGAEYSKNVYLPEIPVTFTVTSGSLSSTYTVMVDKKGEVVFTPNAAGEITVTAQIGTDTVSKTINVVALPLYVSADAEDGDGDGSLDNPYSLQDAIDIVNSGGSEKIELLEGNYSFPTAFVVANDVSIRPYKDAVVNIKANNGFLSILADKKVEISNVTFADGISSSAPLFNLNGNSALDLTYSVIKNNKLTGMTTAIIAKVAEGANLNIAYSQIVGNGATWSIQDMYGAYFENHGTIVANNNWWGSNKGSAVAGTQLVIGDSIDASTYLMITQTQDKTVLRTEWSSIITTQLVDNNNNAIKDYVPPITLTYSTNSGSLANEALVLSQDNNYKVTNTISGVTEKATVEVKADGETLNAEFEYDVPMTEIFLSVDGNDDNDGSLNAPFKTMKKAISRAKESGATIYYLPGTYDMEIYNGYVSFDDRNLTIVSYGGPVVWDRYNQYNLFGFGTNTNVEIKDIIVLNGINKYVMNQAISTSGNLTVRNCLFTNATGGGFGEYICGSGSAHIYVYDSNFTDTYVYQVDNANPTIYIRGEGSYLYIEGCYFENNGGYREFVDPHPSQGIIVTNPSGGEGVFRTQLATVVVTNCNFTKNNGLAMVYDGGYMNFTNCYIRDTVGHVVLQVNSNAHGYNVDNCYFINNTAGAIGIGIPEYIKDNDITVKNSFFYNNTAEKGGAIRLDKAGALIENCYFEGNNAIDGGAIYNYYASLLIKNCEFVDNNATDKGGVIYTEGTDDYITIEDNKFTNSNASMGGVIYSNGITTLRNNEMTGATALNGSYIYNANRIGNTYIFISENKTYEDYATREITLTATLTDDMANPITGGNVIFIIDGAEYVAFAQEGTAVFKYVFNTAGTYYVDGNYSGNRRYLTGAAGATYIISKMPTSLKATDVKINVGETAVFTISLTDVDGNKLANGTISLSFNDEVIENVTNDEGVAIFELPTFSLTPGVYVISAEFKSNETHDGNVSTYDVYVKGDSVISIVKIDGNMVIEGTLKYINGAAISNAVIKYNVGNEILNVTTDENGSFKLSNVQNGVTNIVFEGNDVAGESEYSISLSNIASAVDPDKALDIPANSKTPTYSIDLPKDATGNFSVVVDGKVVETKALVNGAASITVSNLASGNHAVSIIYSGDDKYSAIVQNTTLTVPQPVISLSGNKNINMLYSAGTAYSVRVTADGKAVSGVTVAIKFNGKTYYVKTNANGYATLKLPTVKPKSAKYTITATYAGKTVKNTVKVNSIIKAANKKVKKSKKVTKVKVSLKKVNGKYLKSKTIKIKFRGKTYKVKTNKKGVATWKVKKSMLKKLKVGKKYKYKVTYGKDTVTKKLTIKK